ncbi:MAG: UDP-N-acetylmuramoyl-L-alanine--D-glutamate ligase [Spirochaetaceae bacterium]|jgi:UDP-N-acetylmuramoylalanine--D-glutamate ligase|nr:UDP-N-acetylmuramoyl-L-alanine--D-glutamate ligase [Spirochaetaceae bacterium]
MRVLVMGLGIHGGGVESARYLISRGAEVTVTDLRDEKALAPSIEKLGGAGSVRYVLGCHRTEDFERADMVIKNPGVPPDSPFLRAARRIETDISLFLTASPARLTAVTGSKGKSTTASAIHWVLQEGRNRGLLSGKSHLGGNITRSPLTFLESLDREDDVVLELSSWQLGDLRDRTRADADCHGIHSRSLLKPRCAVITSIMADHLNRYGTMENYAADKRIIYRGQDRNDATIAADDDWGRSFLGETPGRPLRYGESPLPAGLAGGWISGPAGSGYALLPSGDRVEVVPPRLLLPGRHQKKNLLAAALALLDLGLPPDLIREALGTFPGIEHRLEFFYEKEGVRFYNDTAATIPEAAAAAVDAFEPGPVLVTGGTDKNLDFAPLVRAAVRAKALVLLAGSGSDKLCQLLNQEGIPYRGPFDSVDAAVRAALETAAAGDTVVLSPGCASFGMFKNEFDRGAQWKEAVCRLI